MTTQVWTVDEETTPAHAARLLEEYKVRRARDGVVELQGYHRSSATRLALCALIAGIPGIVRTLNNATAMPPRQHVSLTLLQQNASRSPCTSLKPACRTPDFAASACAPPCEPQPGGFGHGARILNFPGGMLGDVGLFVSWPQYSANRA